MSLSTFKRFLVGSVIMLAVVAFFIIRSQKKEIPIPVPIVEKKEVVIAPTTEILGTSVEGRSILLHRFGTGTTHLVFVGGIHGGYEWNSVLLAYTFIDYLKSHPEIIPKNLTIDIIPSANPDAVHKVTGTEGRFAASDVSTNKKTLESARFNAHTVDINRNFDCKWKKESTWRQKKVSAGTAAFSEPETRAITHYITTYKPVAAIFWHSQSNGVYASQCEHGVLPETLTIMNAYSEASGYPAIKIFDAYEVTGAADDWLASIAIPAITVELKTHETIEWKENLAGITALLNLYKR